MNINKEKVKEIQKDATQLLNQVWLKYGLRKSENWKDSYRKHPTSTVKVCE
jgi:hypothetical protein